MRNPIRQIAKSIRGLARNPSVSLAVVVSLALGIAVGGAAWRLVAALFWDPLPVEAPDRLVSVFGTDVENPGYFPISHPNFEDLRDAVAPAADLVAYQWTGIQVGDFEPPEQRYGQIVSPDFFEVLGLRAGSGRVFRQDRDRGQPVVVISDRLSRQLFGGPQGAVGSTVRLGERPWTVLGVAPSGFHGVGAMGIVADAWLPMWEYERVSAFPDALHQRNRRMFGIVGRLAVGTGRGAAGARVDSVAGELSSAFPADNEGLGATVTPFSHVGVDPNQRARYVLGSRLLLAVALILLVTAGASASMLLQARVIDRRRDDAVRFALGASVGDVVRRPVYESVILALVGGGVGLALIVPLLDLVWRMRPPTFQEDSLRLALGGRSIAVVVGLALASGLAVAVIPALQARRHDVVTRLKSDGASAPGSRPRWLGFRTALVLVQVVLGTVSLVTAMLWLRSLDAQRAVDLGFETRDRFILSVARPAEPPEGASETPLENRVRAAVAAVPGVRSAALAAYPPLALYTPMRTVAVEGEASASSHRLMRFNVVDGSYFDTLGLRLLRGRGFEPSDRDGPWVAVINQEMADALLPGRNPLGASVRLGDDEQAHRIVGVVSSAKYVTPVEEPQPYAYLLLAQHPSRSLTLHVASAAPAATLMQPVRRELRRRLPGASIGEPQTLSERVRGTLWASELAATTSSILGLGCLTLVTLGVFSTVAFLVRTQERELAIRLALGARRSALIARVMRRNLVPVLASVAVGLVLAAMLARLFSSVLYGTSAGDVLVYFGASMLLGVVATIACLVPAWRASRADVRDALG